MKRNIRDILKNANAVSKDGQIRLKADFKVKDNLPLTGVFPASYIGETGKYIVTDVLRDGKPLVLSGDKDGREWNIYDGEVHDVKLNVTANDITSCRVLTKGLIRNTVDLKGRFFDSPEYGKGRVLSVSGDRITLTFGRGIEKVYIYPRCIALGQLYTEDKGILSVVKAYAEKRNIDWKASLAAAKPCILTKEALLEDMSEQFKEELKIELNKHAGEENEKLYNELVTRNIKYIYHFTRIENLDAILENGIVPRTSLDESGASYMYNDENRFENMEHCVCLSVGYPNHYYLSRMANDLNYWVILRLHAGLLFGQKNYYAKHNAATASVNPAEGVEGFREMFSDSFVIERAGGEPLPFDRTDSVCGGFPTSVQAEVLAEGVIDPRYILDIISASDREGCITDREMFLLNREEYFK